MQPSKQTGPTLNLDGERDFFSGLQNRYINAIPLIDWTIPNKPNEVVGLSSIFTELEVDNSGSHLTYYYKIDFFDLVLLLNIVLNALTTLYFESWDSRVTKKPISLRGCVARCVFFFIKNKIDWPPMATSRTFNKIDGHVLFIIFTLQELIDIYFLQDVLLSWIVKCEGADIMYIIIIVARLLNSNFDYVLLFQYEKKNYIGLCALTKKNFKSMILVGRLVI